VEAVDTTGAGDCFNGVFVAGLVEGLEASAAARRAAAAAALSVTKPGAREGMPTRDELEAFLHAP
jgi:sugar/nucleoside kinase (ribokinase family)